MSKAKEIFAALVFLVIIFGAVFDVYLLSSLVWELLKPRVEFTWEEDI